MSSHHRYSTASSHVIVAGTGIYCIVKYTKYNLSDNYLDLPLVTFAVIVLHSLLGIWRWGNPDYGDKISKLFEFTLQVRNALALSCFSGYMIIKAGYDNLMGLAVPVISSIPLAVTFTARGVREDFVDGLIGINILLCAWFSYLNENWWGVGAAISCMFSRFSRYAERDIPDEDLSNFALCFFAYFAYRACGAFVADSSLV